ncbi:MAG: hypothetical protein HY043_11760 [Verrucomicrobia bacterium]|nr:hypothetical protein [Verrucomicrobiota bacterium]
MDLDLELVALSDAPALLALSTIEWLATAKSALKEIGYKVHTASNHEDFVVRFGRVQYQVVILEELFAANTVEENLSLQFLQQQSMNRRRHAVSIFIANDAQTLNPMQAFQASVHAVINPTELGQLQPIVQQVVANHDRFMKSYRDAETRLANAAAV